MSERERERDRERDRKGGREGGRERGGWMETMRFTTHHTPLCCEGLARGRHPEWHQTPGHISYLHRDTRPIWYKHNIVLRCVRYTRTLCSIHSYYSTVCLARAALHTRVALPDALGGEEKAVETSPLPRSFCRHGRSLSK